MAVERTFQEYKKQIAEETNKMIRGEEREDATKQQIENRLTEFNESIVEAISKMDIAEESFELEKVQNAEKADLQLKTLQEFIEEKINELEAQFADEGVTLSGRGTKFQQIKEVIEAERDKKIRNEERIKSMHNESSRLFEEAKEILEEHDYEGEVNDMDDLEKVIHMYETKIEGSFAELKEILEEEGVDVE